MPSITNVGPMNATPQKADASKNAGPLTVTAHGSKYARALKTQGPKNAEPLKP